MCNGLVGYRNEVVVNLACGSVDGLLVCARPVAPEPFTEWLKAHP